MLLPRKNCRRKVYLHRLRKPISNPSLFIRNSPPFPHAMENSSLGQQPGDSSFATMATYLHHLQCPVDSLPQVLVSAKNRSQDNSSHLSFPLIQVAFRGRGGWRGLKSTTNLSRSIMFRGKRSLLAQALQDSLYAQVQHNYRFSSSFEKGSWKGLPPQSSQTKQCWL